MSPSEETVKIKTKFQNNKSGTCEQHNIDVIFFINNTCKFDQSNFPHSRFYNIKGHKKIIKQETSKIKLTSGFNLFSIG